MTAPTRPFAPFATPPRIDPAYTAWNTVTSYDDYAAAQRAVEDDAGRCFAFVRRVHGGD